MTRALLMALALVGVAGLPVAVVRLFRTAAVGRLTRGLADRRSTRRERRTIARLDRRTIARLDRRTIARLERAIGADALAREVDVREFDRPGRQRIEQIAADLRRLGGHRLGAGGRVAVWHSTVVQAYDERLRLACRCLGLTEHLAELTGFDLQIERIRVEGELHAAGLTIPAATVGHPERLR